MTPPHGATFVSAATSFIVSAAVVGAGAAASAQAPEVPVECGTDVQLAAVALFNPPVPGPVTYEWQDASGRTIGKEVALHLGALKLPPGKHAITVKAHGAEGHEPTTTLTVIVADTARPRLTVAGRVSLLDGSADLTSAAGLRAADGCDPSPALVVSPPGPYPPGDTSVTVTARDASGNTTEQTLIVQVPSPPPAPVEHRPAPSPRPTAVVTPPPPRTAPPPTPPPPVAAPTQAEPVAAPPSPAPALQPIAGRRYPWWLLAPFIVLLLIFAARIRRKPPAVVIDSRPTLDPGTQRIRWKGPPALRTERRSSRS